MSKFASFAEYPARSLVGAEAALLTAWASLGRFHQDLVLVGGLAVKYLTTPGTGLLPGAVTMDVDLGVTLATEGGQYGTLADDLVGQGFRPDLQAQNPRAQSWPWWQRIFDPLAETRRRVAVRCGQRRYRPFVFRFIARNDARVHHHFVQRHFLHGPAR